MSLDSNPLRTAWAAWLPRALPLLEAEEYAQALVGFPKPEHLPLPFLATPPPAERRIAFITSSGAYDTATQTPFLARSAIGDASHRVFPTMLADERIGFSHGHYDDQDVLADREVLLPRRALALEGAILTTNIVSTMGYAIDWPTLIEATVPQLIQQVKNDGANCALLVPV